MDARIIVGAEGFFRVEERSGLRTRCRGGGARTTLTLFPRGRVPWFGRVWTLPDVVPLPIPHCGPADIRPGPAADTEIHLVHA